VTALVTYGEANVRIRRPILLLALLAWLAAPALLLARDLVVASWNLQWFPGRVPYANAEARQRHMTDAQAELKALNPDLLIAQEITSEWAFRELVSAVPDLQVQVVSAFPRGDSPKALQVGIASRLPSRSAWAASWQPAQVTPPRGYACAVFEPAPGLHLLVYSVHLKSNRTEPGLSADQCRAMREESARQLLAHVEEMTAFYQKDGPVMTLLGGDFNTHRDQPELAADRTLSLIEGAGFANPWTNVAAPQRHTWVGSDDFPPCTFDYLFGRGLALRNTRLQETKVRVSDHLPVVGLLRLPATVARRHAAPAL